MQSALLSRVAGTGLMIGGAVSLSLGYLMGGFPGTAALAIGAVVLILGALVAEQHSLRRPGPVLRASAVLALMTGIGLIVGYVALRVAVPLETGMLPIESVALVIVVAGTIVVGGFLTLRANWVGVVLMALAPTMGALGSWALGDVTSAAVRNAFLWLAVAAVGAFLGRSGLTWSPGSQKLRTEPAD